MPTPDHRSALLGALDAEAQAFAADCAERCEIGAAIARADTETLSELAGVIIASAAAWRPLALRLDLARLATFESALAAELVIECVFDSLLTPSAWRVLYAAAALKIADR